MKRINKAILKNYIGIQQLLVSTLKSQKGSYEVITAIIFGAIVILAVIATNTTIQDIFTSQINKFRNWLDGKTTTLFS